MRPNANLTVSGGALRIPAENGDLYGGSDTAQNLVLRDAPDGPWQATAEINFVGDAQYHQAGLLVYGDDSNYTKLGRIAHTPTGDEKFEYIYETAGTPRNEAPDSTANLPGDFPDDYFVRITSDGTNISGAYSIDGTTWVPVGRPAPLPADARVGMFAFNNEAAASPEAAFESFELVTGTGGGGSRSDQFDGATLDTDRWNAIVNDNPEAYEVVRRRACGSRPSPATSTRATRSRRRTISSSSPPITLRPTGRSRPRCSVARWTAATRRAA